MMKQDKASGRTRSIPDYADKIRELTGNAEVIKKFVLSGALDSSDAVEE